MLRDSGELLNKLRTVKQLLLYEQTSHLRLVAILLTFWILLDACVVIVRQAKNSSKKMFVLTTFSQSFIWLKGLHYYW